MSDKKIERRGLGRGLSALMADIAPAAVAEAPTPAGRSPQKLPIDKLAPNPLQPRRDFAPAALEELASSIRAKGIIQPLVVRPVSGTDRYEIVAGERRWRAAQAAQLHEVPVVVRDFDDGEVLEIAIIENIQRADLNAIEEALAYRQLMDRFGHTQEAVAEALSKSRSHIANLLRLLTLPEDVQRMVREGVLSAGHARAMVTAAAPLDLARRVAAEGLSVRETEALARAEGNLSGKTGRKAAAPRGVEKDADTRALEGDLSATLGMEVAIDHGAGEGGVLTIRYASLDELDFLCGLLSTADRSPR
jgi:ParB family chromosome partitioning protein